MKFQNLMWWCAHFVMWLRGDRGCGGEGYTLDARKQTQVCYRRGCH